MTKDEALKLALKALEAAYARLVTKCEQNLVTYNGVDVDTLTLSQEAITAIKEALAQRTWVGLTDEEIQYCVELKNPEAIAEEIEAKLKEKNGL